jgi:hypothetical protein
MDRYEIRVAGHLGDRRARTFEPHEIHRMPDGSTALIVHVRDQAALHALITRVRDLGLELLEVRRDERRAQ